MKTGVSRAVVVSAVALASSILAADSALSQAQLYRLAHTDEFALEQFGISCDLSGDRAIVESDWNLHTGIYSGSAFLYDVTTGQQLFELLPSDLHDWMSFGYSVAIAGDRAVVGAYSNSVPSSNQGAAYLFDVNTGLELQKLVPADNASGDHLGTGVAITDEYIVIGAPGDTVNGAWSGSAYVFSTVSGQELRKLVPADGSANDNFGCSVAVSGDRIVVGAFYDDPKGWISGSAYVFEASTGAELFKLSPADGAAEDLFGWRVAIDGSNALIGAYQDDDQGVNSGSAYIFDAMTGAQLHKLLPSSGTPNTNFGYDVAVRGGVVVIGKPFDHTTEPNTGCAFSFDAHTGEEFGQLLSEDGQAGDQFGWGVGVDGNRAVVGAPFHDNRSGTAYLFDPLPIGIAYCFGDLGSGTPCPCANDNDGSVPGSGCANGAFASGAQLTAEGNPGVSDDTLVLTTTGMDPNNSGLYFQANNRIDEGNGSYFGDGLRCAGGGLIRLQVRASNAAGVSSTTISIAAKGGVSAGDTKRYQCWYRDNSGMQPCGAGVYDFNLSNGFEITWRP